MFKVVHPKEVRAAVAGTELAVCADARIHVLDFLAARGRHLRAPDLEPYTVAALIPSELGRHYSGAGFRNLRGATVKDAGIEGDCRVLRRTHEQILMDRLEAHDYKEGSTIEISAERLCHSMQTAVRHYADLRTDRGKKAAQEAWETPLVKVKDASV